MKEIIMIKDKSLKHTYWLVVLLIVLCSCDAGFDAMNVDDTALTSVDPVFQLNEAIMESELQGNHIRCEASIVKQQMRIFTGVGACGNFNVNASSDVSSTIWNIAYQTQLKNLIDAQRNVDSNTNLYQMIRIWKAYVFMIVTDSYGDIPYSEASLGFLEGNVFPDYDSQEDIYTSDDGILEELANAAAALDPNLSTDNRVILYGGDINKWKRLGYSLLLKGAMRLTNINPGLAENYVNIAVDGGLMQSNEDNALIRHNAAYSLGIGNALNGGQAHFQYLIEDFVDFLQNNNDPRLASIAVRYPNAAGAGDQNEANADRDPANQIGIPMGYNNNTITPVAQAAGLPSFMAYSQIDRTRMMDPQSPSFLVTYSLQQFYLAEAAFRNWIAGDPAVLYESAIEAHMQQFVEYGEDTAIDQSEINDYIQANPLVPGSEMEQIYTQFWVASYLIPTESWANFRRTGYPDLVPNPLRGDLSGSDEDFMRRFAYPSPEVSINSNAQNGVSPDEIYTRVWWDVAE